MKALGATGGDVFAVYCSEIAAGGAVRNAHRRRAGRGLALCHRLGLRQHHSAAGRAGAASGRARAVDRLWPPHRACLCAVAARTRPRHFGDHAVSRPDRRRAQLAAAAAMWLRRRPSPRSLPRSPSSTSYDPRIAVYFVIAAAVVFCAAAADRAAHDGACAPCAARALDDLAAGHRQYSPPRCADAERHAVAWPGTGAARHRDRDRRQSASRIGRCAARARADVLFPRCPGGRRGALRCFRRATRRRARRSSTCRCCAAASSRPTASRRTDLKAGGRLALGAARRPRHHLCDAQFRPARVSSPANGGSADYSGPPLVSLESRTAHNLDLKIGDTVTVNVLGRNITARIANLRAVDWENLGINFVLVFSPGPSPARRIAISPR